MDERESRTVSRRSVVGGVGLGMAVAAAGPALAQQAGQESGGGSGSSSAAGNPTSGEPMIDDPRSKYPKPPFRKQTQPWPGLASGSSVGQ